MAMKKKLVLLFVIISLTVNALAACSGERTPVKTQSISKPSATAEKASKEKLITALENLRDAMLKKIDNDVHLTASSFAGVKDYWRTKRWADVYGAPLTVIEEAIQTIETVTSFKELFDQVNTGLEKARFPYDVTATLFSVSELREAGGELYLGINGPLYISAVETMLEEADSTTVTAVSGFSKEHYQRVIENYLLGVQGEPVTPVPRHSTGTERQVTEVVNGASQVKVSIKRSFDRLIRDIESRPLPDDFPTEQVIENLESLDRKIDRSRLENVETEYPNKTSRNNQITLGSVSVRHQVWGTAADHLASRVAIEIEQEFSTSVGSIVTVASWRFPDDELIKIMDDFATFMELSLDIDELYFSVDPEEVFYMQPQEMMLVLPMELSNLWMVADDTVEYLTHLLGLPSLTPQPSSTATHKSIPSITPTPMAKGIIAYEAPQDSGGGIWTINPDGSDNKLISPPHSSLHDWAPDGSKIIYEYRGVVSANPDGSERKIIWEHPIEYGLRADMAHLRLAQNAKGFYTQWRFHTGVAPFPGEWGLRYVDLSTLEVEKIFEKDINQVDVLFPSESIVFVRSNYERSSTSWTESLSVVDKNGQNEQKLLTLERRVEEPFHVQKWGTLIESPSWSPDGEYIAFYSTKPTDPPESATLCVINADGSDLRELREVTLPEYSWLSNGDITWSPDGKRIAYVDGGWIWIIHSSGEGEPQKLVKGHSPSWAVKVQEETTVETVDHIEGNVWSVDIKRNYAYLAGQGMHIVDISNPESLQQLNFQDIRVEDLYVSNDFAYLTSDGLKIMDISNPKNPTEIGYYVEEKPVPQHPQLGDLVVSGNYVLVLSQGEGVGILQVFDISNPQKPALVDSYIPDPVTHSDDEKLHPSSYPEGIFIDGSYLYLTTSKIPMGGLKILDISDPDNIYEVGYIEFPGYTRGIYVVGSYAYIAFSPGIGPDTWSEGGLGIVDVSDPSKPFRLGFVNTPGEPQNVAVSENLAYVADGESGLRIIDVSSPYEPYEVSAYDTPGTAFDIKVMNGYIYLADGKGGFFVLRYLGNGDTEEFDIKITPTPFVCIGAPSPRLWLGGYAYVALDPYLPNKIRNGPGTDYATIGRIQPGEIMEISGGPKCIDRYVWWQVQALDTGIIGWTAEGNKDDYWLIPCESKEACENP